MRKGSFRSRVFSKTLKLARIGPKGKGELASARRQRGREVLRFRGLGDNDEMVGRKSGRKYRVEVYSARRQISACDELGLTKPGTQAIT